MNSIIIYTDGAAKGNPGPGGYGVVLKFGKRRKELSEGFRLTTNNRMELLAVIVGLEALKNNKHPSTIYSDSKYVVETIEKGWLRLPGYSASGAVFLVRSVIGAPLCAMGTIGIIVASIRKGLMTRIRNYCLLLSIALQGGPSALIPLQPQLAKSARPSRTSMNPTFFKPALLNAPQEDGSPPPRHLNTLAEKVRHANRR